MPTLAGWDMADADRPAGGRNARGCSVPTLTARGAGEDSPEWSSTTVERAVVVESSLN